MQDVCHPDPVGYARGMNVIERVFQAILQTVSGLVRALVGGFVSAPATAARRAIGGVSVRRAVPAEVIDVRHAVLREGRPRATAIFDGDDHATTRHWIAKLGDDVVGVVSVMQADFPDLEVTLPTGDVPHRQLRGMATVPSVRGKGVGRAMLAAIDAELPEPLWCNARIGAAEFYARHGWQRVGGEFEIPGVGPHVRMVRVLDAGEALPGPS